MGFWLMLIYDYNGKKCVPPRSWSEARSKKGRLVFRDVIYGFNINYGVTFPAYVVAYGLFMGNGDTMVFMKSRNAAKVSGPGLSLETRFPEGSFNSTRARPGIGLYKLEWVNYCESGRLQLWSEKLIR